MNEERAWLVGRSLTFEVKTGKIMSLHLVQLHSEFKANLDYMRICHRKQKRKGREKMCSEYSCLIKITIRLWIS